jgi:death on curing protein
MPYVYLTLEQAVEIHSKTVDVSGGGVKASLELGKLESVLANIQNDDYYPSFDAKLTHLFHSACMFHCFVDGNKRLAIALSAQMLLLNGYLRSVKAFMYEAENISYHVASGAIGKELLGKWILAVLKGEDDDEALKLSIWDAISQHPANRDLD